MAKALVIHCSSCSRRLVFGVFGGLSLIPNITMLNFLSTEIDDRTGASFWWWVEPDLNEACLLMKMAWELRVLTQLPLWQWVYHSGLLWRKYLMYWIDLIVEKVWC